MSSAYHAGCVLLGHPHQRLSEGLRSWLQASFDGVFVVADRASLVQGAHRLQPALVILDLALAEGGLAALIGDLQQHAPAARMLVMSDHDDAHADAATLAAGAAGVVHKATLGIDLSAAIEAVLADRPLTKASGPQDHEDARS